MNNKTQKTYQFKKMYTHVEESVLKQKDVNSILAMINGGRLKHLIKFEGFGLCEHDETDTKLEYGNITMMDKFNRLRTNIMVFEVFNNDWSHGMFDKMYIFKTIWPRETVFNIVFHNTSTGKVSHTPEVEYAYDILVQDIVKAFNIMHKKKIIDFYSLKHKACKENKFYEGIQERYYNDIMNEYYNAQWDNPNENEILEDDE